MEACIIARIKACKFSPHLLKYENEDLAEVTRTY